MALTDHQILHLEAVIDECAANKLESQGKKDRLSDAKGIPRGQYIKYLNMVDKEADDILKEKEPYPEDVEFPSEIHDKLEKNRGGDL